MRFISKIFKIKSCMLFCYVFKNGRKIGLKYLKFETKKNNLEKGNILNLGNRKLYTILLCIYKVISQGKMSLEKKADIFAYSLKSQHQEKLFLL